MPDLFDIYFEAVENLEWSFSLTCSALGLDAAAMADHLGCDCPYGLLGYVEESA
jgi:hypothetical protein